MPRIKILVIGILATVLLLQGLTGGAFLSLVMPGWEQTLGRISCVVGGYIVQPIWDVGWAKIPIPVMDDVAAGLLIASFAGWLFIKRTQWSFRRKLIAFILVFVAGMALYKAIGLVILYWAEISFGMENCIGEFGVGPFTIKWEWFNPMFYFMVFFAVIGMISAILAFRHSKGGASG